MPFVAGSEAGPWSTITAARAYSCEHILWCDYFEQSIEPYKSKIRLETAINVWEKKAQEYQRVWYSWTAGLLMIAWYMSDRMQGRVQSDES